mmetsp:Transcript_14855/g.36910  ORF Transcript_14855/g.36910 Transcript_14855/m.36910 type:complete len:201 (-) Transcript_14855:900-1502(-)
MGRTSGCCRPSTSFASGHVSSPLSSPRTLLRTRCARHAETRATRGTIGREGRLDPRSPCWIGFSHAVATSTSPKSRESTASGCFAASLRGLRARHWRRRRCQSASSRGGALKSCRGRSCSSIWRTLCATWNRLLNACASGNLRNHSRDLCQQQGALTTSAGFQPVGTASLGCCHLRAIWERTPSAYATASAVDFGVETEP